MTDLDLMNLTAAALHERAAYIVQNAESIGVRIKREGCLESVFLAELPPRAAIREAFRLLLRAEVPVRSLTRAAISDRIDTRSTEAKPLSRWAAFPAWELQALDELLHSFGPMRSSNPDIANLGNEIAKAMAARKIERFHVPDSLDTGSTDLSKEAL